MAGIQNDSLAVETWGLHTGSMAMDYPNAEFHGTKESSKEEVSNTSKDFFDSD